MDSEMSKDKKTVDGFDLAGKPLRQSSLGASVAGSPRPYLTLAGVEATKPGRLAGEATSKVMEASNGLRESNQPAGADD